MQGDITKKKRIDTKRAARVISWGYGHPVFLFGLLSLSISLVLSATLNLWIDEAYSMRTVSRTLGYAVRHALYFEQQPPLYFVLLWFWRRISDSPLFLRLFSALVVVLTIWVVNTLAKRLLGVKHSTWFTAAFAFNPFVIWASTEMRMYALVILLSSLLMLFFHAGYLSENNRTRVRVTYVVCSVAALYTYYYLGFLLVAHACVLLVLKRWKAFGWYLFDMGCCGICLSPLVPVIVGQVSRVNSYHNSPLSSFQEGIRVAYWNVAQYLIAKTDFWVLQAARKWIVRAGIIAMAFLVVTRFKRFLDGPALPLSVAFAIQFVLLLGASAMVGKEFLKIQHSAILFLPSLLLVLCLLSLAGRRHIVIGGCLVMFAFYAGGQYDTWRVLAKGGDWVRVASYITKHEEREEPILIFRSDFALDFGYHYRGLNQIIPLPRTLDLEHYDLTSQALHNESELANILAPLLSLHQRFWLITLNTDPFRGVNFHPEILEEYVATHFVTVSRQRFYGSEVRLLDKRRGPQRPIAGVGETWRERSSVPQLTARTDNPPDAFYSQSFMMSCR